MNYAPSALPATVTYKSLSIDGLNIAYREAGDPSHPKLVLLHGFPSSSHQYRNLIPALADRFHVISPDYPGFGNSDAPDPSAFPYTFDHLAEVIAHFLHQKGFHRFGLYAQDYGGPVGFRIVTRRPEALEWLIIQNTNAYEVGFTAAWGGLRNALWHSRTPENEAGVAGLLEYDTVKAVYLHGSTLPELISPDNWNSDYFTTLQKPNGRRSSSISSTTTAPMWRFTRSGRPFSSSASRRPSSSGDRTTSSSPVRAEKPTSLIFQMRKCIASMQDTSQWKIASTTSRITFTAFITTLHAAVDTVPHNRSAHASTTRKATAS